LAARKILGLMRGSSHQNEGENYSLQNEMKKYFSMQADGDTDIITFWKVIFSIYYI
jgi:hypothetical protein